MAMWRQNVYDMFDVALATCPKDFGEGFHGFLKKLFTEMKKPHLDDKLLKAFYRASTSSEVTAALLDSPALRPLLTLPAENFTYDDRAADALREGGNAHFKCNRFEEALKAYNSSILQCQREPFADRFISKCLPLSYANRSAVLYQLGELPGCLADIDAAIAKGYPVDMVHKLYERKVRCLVRLHKYSDAEKALAAARESLSTATLAEKEKQVITKLLDCHAQVCATAAPKAPANTAESSVVAGSSSSSNSSYQSAPPLSHGVNDKYTALSAAVDVVENDRYGRHVVCKQKIDVGDVVAVEEPFVAVLVPTCSTTHCYFCLQRYGLAFYPCRRCSVALYCSQECELRSWLTYHRYECHKMLALTGCGHHLGHLSLRATLVAGLVHHASHSGPCLGTADRSSPESRCCALCPPGYNRIIQQGIPADTYSQPALFYLPVLAVYLALCTHPDVSGLIPSCTKSGKSYLHDVAAVTFTHLAAFAHRVHSIYETIREQFRCNQLRTGMAIYPHVNLFNHACDAGVYRTYHGTTVVMRSVRTLLPGEQLFNMYGASYLSMTRQERQLHLKTFNFVCKCVACENNWPTMDVLERQIDVHPLPSCVHKNNWAPGIMQCPSCLVRLFAVIDVCRVMIRPDSGRDQALIKRLTMALSELYSIALPPHLLFVECTDKLTFCYDLMGNLYNVAPRGKGVA